MIRLSSISSVLPYWFVGRRSRKTTCGIGGSKLFAWIWVDHGRSAFTMRVWVWQSYWYVLMPPAELVIFLLWFIAIGGFSHHSHTHTLTGNVFGQRFGYSIAIMDSVSMKKNRKHPRITIDQPWIHREIHHFAAQFWHLSLGSVSHCKEMAPVYVLRGGPFERFLYFDAETYWRVGSCEYKDQDPAEIGQRFLRCVKGDYIFFMIDGI